MLTGDIEIEANSIGEEVGVDEVLRACSFRDVLEEGGKAFVIDLCEHSFEEFREEMGDIHLGFDTQILEGHAQKFFSHVIGGRMDGICCESSGRSAELFIAFLY